MSSARLIAGVFALATAMFASGGADAALTIGGGATQYVICAAHVCRAIRPSAVLNATQLATMLAVSDVTVVSGSKAQDIVVHTAFSWTSTHRLTLDSYRSIAVGYAVTVAGPGAVTLTTNDGGSGGAFTTQFPGRIDFWDLSSSLVINGTSYTLVGDIATLASAVAANASGHYALAKNYDASIEGTYRATPIPTPLAGAFEGLGHIIEHLTIHDSSGSQETALFAKINAAAMVENFGLTEVSVRGNDGGFNGNVVAGLAAANYGSIANTFAKGRVSAGNSIDNNVGGLVGDNEGGYIEHSYTTGNVVALHSGVGGLVGSSTNGGSIDNSHSTANVFGTTDSNVGGLVGGTSSPITNSWAAGTVTVGNTQPGLLYIVASGGGLAGYAAADVTNCYAIGSVTGGQQSAVGALVGMTGGGVATADYAIGRTGGNDSLVGGVVGDMPYMPGTFSDTYWDTDTTGVGNLSKGVGNIPNEPGITGLSNAQLTSGLPAGFDPTAWAEKPSINGGRPYLIANPPTP